MALVLKEWWANETPDKNGTYIHIVGREPGLWSFILSMIGVEATTRFDVTDKNIVFEQGSLAGFMQRVIPLRSMSSGFFGYRKPWREALAICAVLGPLTLGLGVIIGIVYYFLNKRLEIGVIEIGNVMSAIAFKRSVLEGKKIDQDEGRVVIRIIEMLINRL